MPNYKSSTTLNITCYQTIIKNFNKFQPHLTKLPNTLINELYQQQIPPYFTLNSDIFINNRTSKLQEIYVFDKPGSQIMKTIAERCKQLSHFDLSYSFNDILFQNDWIVELVNLLDSVPQIRHLDFTGCHWCSDRILLEIGRYCPNLKVLNISRCRNVTDDGIRMLCMKNETESRGLKLERLLLAHNNQHIGRMGYVVAIQHLPNLKEFHAGIDWQIYLPFLKEVSSENDKYPLEVSGNYAHWRENDLNFIANSFPNLKHISILNWEIFTHLLIFKVRFSAVRTIFRRIVRLDFGSIDGIGVPVATIDDLCPNLMSLKLDNCAIVNGNERNLFVNLRELELTSLQVGEKQLGIFLGKFRSLQKFDVKDCRFSFTDGMIKLVVSKNLLSRLVLNNLYRKIEETTLMEIISAPNSLKKLSVIECHEIGYSIANRIRDFIRTRNLDLDFYHQ